jgi:NTE family protein
MCNASNSVKSSFLKKIVTRFALPSLLMVLPLLSANAADLAEKEGKPRSVTSDGPCANVANRPCIALVLGGGGAKGGAHIGVIKALEERNIPVDLVVGTSIGAFVGGLYATGQNSEQITRHFQQADWNSGYRDSLDRSDIPMRRKRQLDEFQMHVDLGVSGKGVSLPQGFIQGQSMKTLLDSMLGIYPNFESFDQLSIPFRAVAADAETGEQVVLAYGDVATAIQASMSLPGIVRPIVHEGRILVDGGIANNIPISVAKDLGANLVIAVDIGATAFDKEKLNSSITILLQLTKFLTGQNVEQQKALLSADDVLVCPDLGDIGLLSFDRVLEAVDKGYQQTVHALNLKESSFRSLVASNNILVENTELQAALTTQTIAKNRAFDDQIFIDAIHLTNNTRLNDDYILHRMGLKPGEHATVAEVNSGVNRHAAQWQNSRYSHRPITPVDHRDCDGCHRIFHSTTNMHNCLIKNCPMGL